MLPCTLYHENFFELLDSKPNLFAFSDCVYDLDTDSVLPHRGDNYVKTNTGYPFPAQRNEAVEKELWELFESMFEDPRDALYMLKTIAYCLHGDKHRMDLFFCWVGRGGNGKGVMLQLIGDAFGAYYKPLPVTFLTQKGTASSAATPELADKAGVRLVASTEPETEEGEKIRVEKIKGFSDDMLVRGLYEKPFVLKVQFALILQSNQDPQFSSFNDALRRRYRGLHFPIQFKSNPDPNNPREKVSDPTIKQKLSSPEYRDAFIRILLDVYRDHVRGRSDLEAPPNVQFYVNDVLEDNDAFGQFVRENIEKTGNEDDKVLSTTMYDTFKELTDDKLKWNASQFGKQMKQYGFVRNKRNYVGVRLKVDEPPSF